MITATATVAVMEAAIIETKEIKNFNQEITITGTTVMIGTTETENSRKKDFNFWRYNLFQIFSR